MALMRWEVSKRRGETHRDWERSRKETQIKKKGEEDRKRK